MTLRLTKYGRRELVVATLAAVSLCAAAGWLAVSLSAWIWLVAALSVAAWAGVIWFFRDPDRHAPEQDGLLISPADGRVADVTQIGPESPLGRDGLQIGIFMNVFDVHVNRAPCDGRVESVTHRSGAFLDARDPNASQANESATIYMTHRRNGKDHPVVVRQIAGLIARRIVTDLSAGQQVVRGQRIGMIKFGSRVEVLVPPELAEEVRVQVGQRVRAGCTVLAAAEKAEVK